MSSVNPYQSPETDITQSPCASGDGANRGLLWLFFSFRGRIPCRQFWAGILGGLATMVVLGAASAVATVLFGGKADLPPVAELLITVVWCWLLLAVSAKRWHDRDQSGWMTLLVLVPFIGMILVLFLLGVTRGTVGRNRFGDDPTGDGLMDGLSQLRTDQPITDTELDLSGQDITDADLAKLADNAEIEELRLGGTTLTDAGLRHLATCAGLRCLDVSQTGVTDEGLASLASLPNLATLWIGGTKVTDVGLHKLAALPALKEVFARSTQITPDGARHFHEVCPQCQVLV